MLLLLTAPIFLSVPMMPSVLQTLEKPEKFTQYKFNIFFSCTSLFLAFTKEILGKMKKFTKIWKKLVKHGLQVCMFFKVWSLFFNLACALVFIFAVVLYWGWFIAVHLGCVLHLASCHYYWHHHHQFSAPYLQLIGLSEVCALPLGVAGSTYWPLLMAFSPFNLSDPVTFLLCMRSSVTKIIIFHPPPLPWYIWGRLNISSWIRTSNHQMLGKQGPPSA